jgi:hypothetical protein
MAASIMFHRRWVAIVIFVFSSLKILISTNAGGVESLSSDKKITPPFGSNFGKAFMITFNSTAYENRSNDQIIYDEITVTGFDLIRVQAFKPKRYMYKDAPNFQSAISEECLGGKSNLTVYELAFVCSHRIIYDIIANDPSTSDDAWSLVLEEDARLHPSFANSSVTARSMIEDTILHSKSAAYGFIYLGLCHPTCGSKVSSTYWDSCHGYCAHAYALTKKRARTFSKELFCFLNGNPVGCGSMCSGVLCHVDQVLDRLFRTSYSVYPFGVPPSASVVGPNLASPYNANHVGIFYQHRDTAKKENDKDETPTCFKLKMNGPIGNLLFQYAFLVGICVFRGVSPYNCVSLDGNKDPDMTDAELYLQNFVTHFKVHSVNCSTSVGVTQNHYRENADNKHAVKYDPFMLQQPFGTTFEVKVILMLNTL